MKPLPTTQIMLHWLFMLENRNAGNWKKMAYISFTFINFGLLFSQVVASVICAMKLLPNDLEKSLYAIYQFFCWFPLVYMFLVGLFSRRQITALIDELTKIFNENAGNDSHRFLTEAYNKSERIWKIYFRLMHGFYANVIANSLTSVLLSLYVHGNFDREYLYLQFELSLPWNVQTPLGYTAEILFSIGVCEAYLALNGTILLLFVSICWYHRAFYHMFQHSVEEFNECEKQQYHHKLLSKLVSFHNSVKGLFFHSAEIYSLFVLVVLIGTMIGLAVVVFQFDLLLKHPNFKLLFLPIAAMVTISNLFVYSDFGKMATESYEKMAQCLFESNWYRCSIKLQKYFILMIQNTNRPLHYNGFGLAILNLETFTKLIKTIFTTYMLLKTVTE